MDKCKTSGPASPWHARQDGQVTTFIVLGMALIFLFTCVAINIGRVAQRKTMVINAADGAVMKYASYLGSWANKLSIDFLGGDDEDCEEYWGRFIRFLMFGPVGLVFSRDQWGWGFLNPIIFMMPRAPDTGAIADAIERSIRGLKMEDQFTEMAFAYAMAQAVDDPATEMDYFDFDEDGDTTDEVMRFQAWFAKRAMELSEEAEADRPTVLAFAPIAVDFANEINTFRESFSEDATRDLVTDEDGVYTPAGVDGEFVILLNDLYAEGITVDFWQPGADTEDNFDQVDDLSAKIYVFYLWAMGADGNSGLFNGDPSNLWRNYVVWMSQLCNSHGSAGTEGGWYGIWRNQCLIIDEWKLALNNVLLQLNDMIAVEPDRVRRIHLEHLRAGILASFGTLDYFKELAGNFNVEVVLLRINMKGVAHARLGKDTYSWHDTAGWHHVRVEVCPPVEEMATIEVEEDSTWYGKDEICVYLVMPQITWVWVEVSRYDQADDRSLFFARGRRGVPIWRFRYNNDAHHPPGSFDPSNASQALHYGMSHKSYAMYYYDKIPEIVEEEDLPEIIPEE